MKALLTPNLLKDGGCVYTNAVIEKLNRLGIIVLMSEDLNCDKIKGTVKFGEFFALLNECDVIIAIGGDGTMIHYSIHASDANKPLLGINLGRLGFLASVEYDELDKLDMLADGNYQIQERMMLSVEIENKNYISLNDVVITKPDFAPVNFEIKLDGKEIANFQSDGVIFSTPTGATGYSLSAGGPVLQPDMSCIAMTPICAHSLFSRTTIFSDDKELEVYAQKRRFEDDGKQAATVVLDGIKKVPVISNQSIFIKKSDKKVKLINLSEIGFYEIINHKFNNKEHK